MIKLKRKISHNKSYLNLMMRSLYTFIKEKEKGIAVILSIKNVKNVMFVEILNFCLLYVEQIEKLNTNDHK